MMAGSIFARAALAVGVMLFAGPVLAGFSIEVRVDNVPVGLIVDDGPDDLNDDDGDIWYHFQLTDAQNRWEAEGDIFAEGGYNGVPPVSTVVTNTLIEKVADVPIFAGEIDFFHNYASSGLQTHTASIDGVFDNTIDHNVQGASLEYSADVNGQSMGGFATGIYTGPGPEPFDSTLGPLLTPTTTQHHMKLRFYLDSLGDSIELFNSAEIHTRVPEPATWGLGLVAVGAVLAARRRREVV
jgi:MYXO-CTERM domain-containing protein